MVNKSLYYSLLRILIISYIYCGKYLALTNSLNIVLDVILFLDEIEYVNNTS